MRRTSRRDGVTSRLARGPTGTRTQTASSFLTRKALRLHQIEGKPIHRLAPGDSVYVGPGVVHWHGAAPDAALTQVNVGFGGATKWGDPVSDAVYRGAAQ